MIGKEIRTKEQLWREIDANELRYLLIQYGTSYVTLALYKSDASDINGEGFYLCSTCHLFDYETSTPIYGVGHKVTTFQKALNSPDNIVKFISKDLVLGTKIYYRVTRIILTPPTSFDEYTAFCEENHKIIENFNNILCYNMDELEYYLFKYYILSNGSKNFFEWMVKNLMLKDVGYSIKTLSDIIEWCESYFMMVKKLKKGSITSYNGKREEFQSLLEEIKELTIEKRTKDAISTFNTSQKKMLKSKVLTKEEKIMLSRFYRLSDKKRINIVKKVSSVDTLEELFEILSYATQSHFKWNRESFLKHIENISTISYEIVYDNGTDILLLQAKTFDTVQYIGKSTNWCISKSVSYWKQYVENIEDAKQYILMDFTKKEDDTKSIIGFTVHKNRGITNAHDFVNNNILSVIKTVNIKSYSTNYRDLNNIYTILEYANINLDKLIDYDDLPFNWNYNDLLNCLFAYVDSSNVDILSKTFNPNGGIDTAVISVKDEDIAKFFGDRYYRKVPMSSTDNEHLLFCRFDMKSSNRLLTAIIVEDKDEKIEYCQTIYDEYFNAKDMSIDTLFKDFRLERDTIRRTIDLVSEVADAISEYNLSSIDKSKVTNEVLRDAINNHLDPETLTNCIFNSIVQYASFDYLDLCYNTGFELSQIMSTTNLKYLIQDLNNNVPPKTDLKSIDFDLPNEEVVERFYAQTLNNISEAKFVACALALKTIIENEKSCSPVNIYSGLLNDLSLRIKRENEVFSPFHFKILELLASHTDMTIETDYTRLLKDLIERNKK